MATNKPDSRKTHITRIFGTNRAGDLLPDVYVDMERMDIVKSAHQVPPDLQWQGLQRQLRWSDDPNADDYDENGTPSRILETLKVCDPEATDDVNDPDEWVPVQVIKGLRSRVETGTEDNGGSAMSRFLASVTQQELKTARRVEVRKIVHYDANIDDDAEAAANAGLKHYVVPSEQYEKDLGSKDDAQFVDHEIILSLKGSGNHGDVSGQGGQTKLLNQYLIDESDDPDGTVIGAAGYNPPYRLDPFQNIVNVNFGSLAVEFFDESFIELPETVSPTKKMVISIFFRVPKKSLDAAKAEYQAWKDSGGGTPRTPLTGVVPVAVLGSSRTGRKYVQETRSVGTVPAIQSYFWNPSSCGWSELGDVTPSQPAEDAHYVFNDENRDIDPSYIGIDCSGGVPKLSVNLVLPNENRATFEGSFPAVATFAVSTDLIGQYGTTSATETCTPPVGNHVIGDGSPCFGVLPFNDFTTTYTYESNADVIMGYRPETFRTLPADTIGEVSFSEHLSDTTRAGGQEVTADVWHHVLLSFDFTRPCTSDGILGDGSTTVTPDTEGSRTTSACQMWVAFDGVNLTRKAMSCYWPSGYEEDRNAILPVNGHYVAGDLTNTISRTSDDCSGNNIDLVTSQQQPKFRYTPVEFEPGKISFPAPGPFIDMDKHIEMGEAQMFTDVAVDPAFDDVMRAFLTESGTPASLKKARDLIGKKPEILVHGSSNWKKARNTGSLADLNIPEDGVVVGTIKTFKPNPKLGE